MKSSGYDYIVVGAGSAGCVITRRLLDAGAGRILLLEAGARDTATYLKMPAGVPMAMARHTWAYRSEPQADTLHRSLTLQQGRVMGGSSSVNGMIYMRGQREDYDSWVDEHDCQGWGYDDLLPYFIRSEANESLASEYHGNDGPLSVNENRYRHPLSMAFVRAAQQTGLPYRNDFNGAQQQGCGFYQTTSKNGERASASRAYLEGVKNNPQLTLLTHALAQRLVIENGRATHLQYRHKGELQSARADKEIILTAGALASPKLLMLSGIGPGGMLKEHGIRLQEELPVGQNLSDHLHLSINAVIRSPISMYGQDRGLARVRNGLQWLAFRSGPVSSNILEGAAFVDSEGSGRADIQVMFLPLLDVWDDPEGLGTGRTHGITLKTCHLRPKSRGHLALRSANPEALPLIYANYLQHPEDVAGQLRGVRFALQLLQAPALAGLIGEIYSPSTAMRADDAALERFVRGGVKTTYHPLGTCKMGKDPKDSVVDTDLRVHGIEGLRVADSSIFPGIVSGNTNAPVMAVAEKAADHILGRPSAASVQRTL